MKRSGAEILQHLRTKLQSLSIDALYIPSSDAHNSEYVATALQRRAYVSNFHGSAGSVLVTRQEALLWTDGRYWLEAANTMYPSFVLMKQGQLEVPSVDAWVKKHLGDGAKVGVDPFVLTVAEWERLSKRMQLQAVEDVVGPMMREEGMDMAAEDASKLQIYARPVKYAGTTCKSKRAAVLQQVEKEQCELMVISALDEIAWLTNLRGCDVPCNPVFYAYAIVSASIDNVQLFTRLDKVPAEVREACATEVEFYPYDDFVAALKRAAAGKRVLVDELQTSKAVFDVLESAGAQITRVPCGPAQTLKAVKTPEELQGFRDCHVRDGAALTQYLAWIHNEISVRGNTSLTEFEAASKLLQLREANELFVQLSFPSISSTGPNAAIIHYSPTETDSHVIQRQQLYLIDSGAQYWDGTTDVTRTICFDTPKPEEVEAYTLVLKGHVALQTTVFPKGVTGHRIDAFARAALWRVGLNYPHGTGHGVGSFLNVHEGPQGIGVLPVPTGAHIAEGMILSNEPGYYKDGAYGIRIENLEEVVVKELKYSKDGFLGFSYLTMAPLCRELIDVTLLTAEERRWVNEYHSKVRAALMPLLQQRGDTLAIQYLEHHTAPLAAAEADPSIRSPPPLRLGSLWVCLEDQVDEMAKSTSQLQCSRLSRAHLPPRALGPATRHHFYNIFISLVGVTLTIPSIQKRLFVSIRLSLCRGQPPLHSAFIMADHAYTRVTGYEGESYRRVALRRENQRRRVRYDRFRVAAVVLLLGAFAMSLTVCVLVTRDARRTNEIEKLAIVTFRLSRVLQALFNEMTVSIKYCATGLLAQASDTVLTHHLNAYQKDTREAFAEAAQQTDGCTVCVNVLGQASLEELLFTQQTVLRRAYTPVEVVWAYRNIIYSLASSMNFFLGKTLPLNSVGIVWMRGVTYGIGALAKITPAVAPGGREQRRVEKMYGSTSEGIAQFYSVEIQSYVTDAEKPHWREAYDAATEPSREAAQWVMNHVDVDLTGVGVVVGSMTAEEALSQLLSHYGSVLDVIGSEEAWKKASASVIKLTVTGSAFMMAFMLGTIAAMLYSMFRILWISQDELIQRDYCERLKRSLERMEFFVDRLYALDQAGICATAERIKTEAHITPPERELVALTPRFLDILGYINQNVLLFRDEFVMQVEAKRRTSAWELPITEPDEGSRERNTHPLQAQHLEPLRAIEVVRLKPGGSSSLEGSQSLSSHALTSSHSGSSCPPAGGGADDKATVNLLPKAVPSGVRSSAGSLFSDSDEECGRELQIVVRGMCFLLVDFSCFCTEFSSGSSALMMPHSIAQCMQRLLRVVRTHGGSYVNTAGSIVLMAFHEAHIPDAANVCVASLTDVHLEVTKFHPGLRFAVLSAAVPQGIIGSPTLKTFLTDGCILYLADLYFRTARLHNAQYVMDSPTFTKVDTTAFMKLALEQVSIDETNPDISTVYQLVPAGHSVDAQLWNDAFDKFQAGEFSKAGEKLKSWRYLHGMTKSWKRLHYLVQTQRRVTYLYTKDNDFDPICSGLTRVRTAGHCLHPSTRRVPIGRQAAKPHPNFNSRLDLLFFFLIFFMFHSAVFSETTSSLVPVQRSRSINLIFRNGTRLRLAFVCETRIQHCYSFHSPLLIVSVRLVIIYLLNQRGRSIIVLYSVVSNEWPSKEHNHHWPPPEPMTNRYEKVETGECLHAERARIRKAKKREAKRIKYDRFRFVVAIALIIVVALSASIFGICISQMVEVMKFKHKASVEFRLSQVLAALLYETTASVKYVDATTNTAPDRVTQAHIEKYQLATREALTEAASSSNECDICPDVLGVVDLESLLYAQRNVIRRSYTPLACLNAYRGVIQSLSEAMNYFLGYTLREGVVDIVWFQNILLGVRSVGMIVPGIMNGDISQDLLKAMYYDVSTCIVSLDNVNSNAYALEANKPEWKTSYTEAVTPPYDGGQAVLDQIDVDLSGIKVEESSYTVEETLEKLSEIYSQLLDKLNKEEPWKKYSVTLEIVTLITTIAIILLSCAAIVLLLYSALSIIWVSPESLYGMRHQERVDSSLERMEFFVDRVYDLDLEGVVYSAQRSAVSKSVTSAERDLLRLAPKLIQVLAFINASIYPFRKNFLQHADDAVEVAVDDDVGVKEASLNPLDRDTKQPLSSTEVVPHRGLNGEVEGGSLESPTGIISQSGAGTTLTDLAETKLVSQAVCFLLVDISCFFQEITPETSKVIPIDVSNFMSMLLKLVKASNGNYVATAGSTVITAFNELDVQDAENTCVMVLVSMQQHILPVHPKIRCAVISSVVPQGIIGSPSLKTYLTDGDVLHLGELLLRIARLHDATFVVDTVTFMKIDTQYFYKLALEQVGIEEEDMHNTTTVYELVPHGKDTSAYLWNEAFDQFHAGEYDQAKEKLKVWRQQHGATLSWRRFYSLLNAKPQPRPITFLFASGDNFEPEFFMIIEGSAVDSSSSIIILFVPGGRICLPFLARICVALSIAHIALLLFFVGSDFCTRMTNFGSSSARAVLRIVHHHSLTPLSFFTLYIYIYIYIYKFSSFRSVFEGAISYSEAVPRPFHSLLKASARAKKKSASENRDHQRIVAPLSLMAAVAVPPRSAEQTSRLLLSSAFRYDTLETAQNKRRVKEGRDPLLTVKLELSDLAMASSNAESSAPARAESPAPTDKKKKKEKHKTDAPPPIALKVAPLPPPVAVNIALFDPTQKLFLGAAYRLPVSRLEEAFTFQATPQQVLVIELLAERPPLPPADAATVPPPRDSAHRVIAWGAFPVDALRHTRELPLYAGTAELLYVESALWPLEAQPPTGRVIAAFKCKAAVAEDAALERLLSALVPPGLIVPYAFVMDTPNPRAKAFRVELDGLQLQPSVKATEAEMASLLDPEVIWSVAVVAHNGYQQLCDGEEVPLQLSRGRGRQRHRGPRSCSSSSSSSSSSYYSYSDDAYSSPKHRGEKKGTAGDKMGKETLARSDSASASYGTGVPLLEAVLPIALERLPVHASTSLVLAIRRRRPGSEAEVLGFCVFPLCLLPMKDRDLRVEDLPALQGPFSCEDARMLLAECATPYGRLPYSLTLSLAFYDTDVAGERTAALDTAIAERLGKSSTHTDADTAAAEAARQVPVVPEEGSGSAHHSSHSAKVPSAVAIDLDIPKVPSVQSIPEAVLSVAAQSEEAAAAAAPAPHPAPATVPQPLTPVAGGPSFGSSAGVFEFLSRIMEELHRVRVVQDDLLKLASSSSQKNMSPALQERLNAKLSDDTAEVIDLRPQPVAVPWQVRQKMVEGAQPILHPTRGTRLDDFSRAERTHTRSVYGIRFEGITMDAAFDVPEDLCFMFSYGPLPFQKVGPVQTAPVQARVEAAAERTSRSYLFLDERSNGGVVWCEPATAEQLGTAGASMEAFKLQADGGLLYLHIFDALTMFYFCTAPVALSHFHRPYNAEAALIPMDLAVQRDLSMTEQPVPANVFPVVLHAGQLHVTLFCVGVPPLPATAAALTGAGAAHHRVVQPDNGPRLVIAKKLPRRKAMDATTTEAAVAGKEDQLEKATAAEGSLHSQIAMTQSLHWKRAAYFKKAVQLQRAQGDTPTSSTPGVPDEHLRKAMCADPVAMEYRLRLLEKERDEAKSRAIALALRERLTVRHEVQVPAWRPQRIDTPFENPYSTAVEFLLDIPEDDDAAAYCTAKTLTFVVGPRQKTEIHLVVRLRDRACASASWVSGAPAPVVKLIAKVYTQQRHLIRVIEIVAAILPPLVDRRYEMYGPAGSSVTKSFYSRQYSSASLPTQTTQEDLVKRLHQLCATLTTSSPETTVAKTTALLDPVTQHYVTAWEEVELTTTIPEAQGQQRVEYITLYRDADKTQVIEVWEFSVFPCFAVTTREVFWGQTTAISVPGDGAEDLYCSSDRVKVEPAHNAFLLLLRPTGVGVDKMLLHTLQNDTLVKTLLSVPVIYPTPTATQVIELSVADVQRGPVLRRLTFTHRGEREEHFAIQHNYKYQLQVSPSRFYLAPGDTQHIHLRMEMLALPPGQLEGRWPMWIFINDGQDKTVESYYLQVVLRTHHVTRIER
eukprot:gene9266-6515_t